MRAYRSQLARRVRALMVLLVAALAVLIPAGPASAHATLVSQAPKSGELLETAPDEIRIEFSEEVSIALGGVRLFSPEGKKIELPKPARSDGGSVITVPFRGTAQGTYTVAWRVISGDSHPISSAFTFSIGKDTSGGKVGGGTINDAFTGSGGDKAVGLTFGIARFLAFTGLSLLVGGLAFLWLVWPAGTRSAVALRLLTGSWLTATVGTAAAFLLQGPYAAGLELGDAFDAGLMGDVLDTRFGTVHAVRLGILLVALYWLRGVGPVPEGEVDDEPLLPPLPFRLMGGLVGGALLLTPGLAGHASTGQYVGLAVPADVLHLAGVAFWLGGLAMLCAAVLPNRDEPLGGIVPRFSQMASWSVVLILVTGTFQSWRQVRFLDALTDTTYGRVLLVKLAAFVGLVGLAAVSRRVVHHKLRMPAGTARGARLAGPGAMLADPDDASRSQLRKSVLAEVVIAVAILSVTSILVNSVPGREAEASPKAKSFFATLESETVDIEMSVEPATVGHNQVHVYTLDKKGKAMGVEELTATLALPAQQLGPLPVKLQKIYDGHWQAEQNIAIPGNWELVFTARLDEFNQERLKTTFAVK